MKKIVVPIALLMTAANVLAQKTDTLKAEDITEVIINQTKKYKNENAFAVSKLPLKDIENPQVYNSIPKAILKDQVSTNFKSVLTNATGITRLWESTSRGGDGAEYYTMRGFSTQSRLVNGMASFNNGGLDPANIENIDVIKGPAGTLYGGSLVSYGGLVNIQTKKPYDHFGGEVNYITGTNDLHRFTLDVNAPASAQLSLRLNTALHSENSFQDRGSNLSFFLAPSLKYAATDRLTFLVNTEFKNNEAANAPMIFLSRYLPLSFNSMDLFEENYKKSYTSSELTTTNPSFSIQTQMIYKLSPQWTSQTQVSTSSSKAMGYYQYLWDDSNGDSFTRFLSKSNSKTLASGIQQNFIGDFKIANMRNRLVVGLDYLTTKVIANDTGWTTLGVVSLVNQTDTGILTKSAADLAVGALIAVPQASAETNIKSAYFSNVLNILPELSAMVSLRVDNFSGKPNQWAEEEIENQTSLSPKLGLVYQPILNRLSVFANYMNGFQYLSPSKVTVPGSSETKLIIYDPERANQWEVGAKANLIANKLSLTASYYDIAVTNKIVSNPGTDGALQGGKVLSKGFEFSAVGTPVEGLNVIAGFSRNESELVSGDVTYNGLRPEEAGPETLVNFWANYKVQQGMLKDLTAGFGLNYASEHKTLNRHIIGTFTLPSYTVMNAMVGYFPAKYSIALKLDNLANKKYFSGWSTVTPQKLRTLSLSLGFNF
ncbi:TonB-dependent siderophore receptor [Chryseobacterium sp.]|uniref:TonB-dependent siderophore receptor n=1 Tax=Chryseobacterium sp. TaxID=1871047 RepID=UPI0011CB6977|nr:TonB-dependent receptor [Chryseobacterium sp.]TXF79457.1 TonB-dependent receptor [Chryseobacterium sp.]